MQRIIVLLIPAAALLFHSCGTPASGKNTSMANDTIPVKVMALDQPVTTQGIAVSGQYTTDDETLLSFKTGGVINSILVKEGDRVHKGQLLATLNLTEINAQVAQAQLNYEKAERDYQRTTNLYKDSVATLEQFQNAKTALDLAGQQLDAAKFNLSYSEIHASQDGYVLKKLANPGQLITSGTTVLQTNGAGNTDWMLRVGLSDQEWAVVKLGDKAQMQISALPGQQIPGAVCRKSEGIDPATGTFTADIRLTGPRPTALATGLFGKGVIYPTAAADGNSGKRQASGNSGDGGNGASGAHGNSDANARATAAANPRTQRAWLIPYEALLDGDGNTGFVFVTNDDKTAHKVKVVIDGMQKDGILISDGLQGTSDLIVSGSAYLNDNSPIRVTNHNQ